MSLPASPYAGEAPEGFVPREEIVRYLERYAASFRAPILEGVDVNRLEPGSSGGFLLCASAGDMRAGSGVMCMGAYQRPRRPEVAAAFPPAVLNHKVLGERPGSRRPAR